MSKKTAKDDTSYEQLINEGWKELVPIRNGICLLTNELGNDFYVLELNNHHFATKDELKIINETRNQWQDKPASTPSETS